MQYGLIGWPLGHSISPEVHALLGSYPYELCPVPEDGLSGFLARRDWKAVNVTIPYKQQVMAYCDTLTGQASACGSVNLLVRQADGTLLGHNTDYEGLCSLICAAGWQMAGASVLILGSGGTGHTAQAAARAMGAAEVAIVSRSGDLNYQNLAERWEKRECYLINTTPVGMWPQEDAKPLSLRQLPHCRGVIDVIYNPIRTSLCCEAASLGIPAVGGLRMLVAQAAAAAPYFGGGSVLPGQVDTITNTLLRRRQNLVLIGMAGSGKSTVGQLLAGQLSRPFYDSDALFAERYGISAGDEILREGEAAFRLKESAIIAELSHTTGAVIATGGGAVLDPRNVTALRHNGFLLWLQRPAELLAAEGRPLSRDPAALAAARRPCYSAAADAAVENDSTVADAAARCLSAWENSFRNE